ncbi:MAG: hypothetical protein J6W10_02670 [Kiritimatiellae bacterium]|nr:hypothetical protein [Kiritimatiellia bacterium]
MTINDLITKLSAIEGLGVYSVRAEVGATLPYSVIVFGSSDNFEADNKTYIKRDNLTIELYSTSKDSVLESKVESVFDYFELPFESDETYDDGQQFYLKYYYITRG